MYVYTYIYYPLLNDPFRFVGVLLGFPWYFSPKYRRKPNVPHCPSSHRLGSSVDLFLCWRWCF